MATTTEFTRGKTILALAVVVGCFAILWPKIFYPSIEGLAGSNSGPAPKDERVIKKNPKKDVCCGVVFDESDVSQQILAQVCSSVLSSYHKDAGSPDPDHEKTTYSRSALALEHGGKLPDKIATQCRQQVQQKCALDITWLLAQLSKPLSKSPVPAGKQQRPSPEVLLAQNLTLCLQQQFNVDPALLSQSLRTQHAVHPLFTPRHMRPERPTYLHPEMMHPALREKGRAIPPMRTIDRQAKPGPVPGMRPPMGGGGHVVTPGKAVGGGGGYGGTMGIIMPIYTIGIIVFFVYTISKVMFRSKEPAPVDNFTSGLQAFKDFPLADPALQRQFLYPETRSSPPPAPKPETVPEEQPREKSLTPEPVIDLTAIPQVQQCTRAAPTTAPREATPPREATSLREAMPLGEATPPVVPAVADSSVPPQGIGSHTATNQQDPELRLHLDIQAQKDLEMDQLRRRLEETEKAMARIMAYMGTVSDKLAPTVVAEVMAHAEKVRQGKEALLSGQASLETENEVMDQTKAFMTLLQEAGVDADLSLSSEIMPEIPSSVANNSTPTEIVPEIINTFSQNTSESLLQQVLAPSHKLIESTDLEAQLPETAALENIQTQEQASILKETDDSAPQDAADLLEFEEQIIPESAEKRTGLQELRSEAKPVHEVDSKDALDLTDIESQILSETLNLAHVVEPTAVAPKPDTEAEPTQTEAPQATQPASVAVMNMEVSVALENKAKMSRSPTPVKDLLPRHKHDSGDLGMSSPESAHSVADSGPQDVSLVFLEAVLPAESQLLVSEAECRAEAVPVEQLDLSESEYETAPVVLSGKMILSVIGMELPPAGSHLEATEIEEMPTDHVTAPWVEEDKTERDAPVIVEQEDVHETGSPTRVHRVRFQPEPEQVIIPANDDEYYYGEDADETQDSSACAAEAADNTLSDFDAENLDEELLLMGASGVELSSSPSSVQVGYRPPTPPMHSEDEEEEEIEVDAEAAQFVTYDELEELGEIVEPVKPDVEEQDIQQTQEQVPAVHEFEDQVQEIEEFKEQVPETEEVPEQVQEVETVLDQVQLVETEQEELLEEKEQEILASTADCIADPEVSETQGHELSESVDTAALHQTQEPVEAPEEEEDIQQNQEVELISAVGSQALSALEEIFFPSVSAVPSIPVSGQNQEAVPEVVTLEEQIDELEMACEKTEEIASGISVPEKVQEEMQSAIIESPLIRSGPTVETVGEQEIEEQRTKEHDIVPSTEEISPVSADVPEEQITSEVTLSVEAEKEAPEGTQEELVLSSEESKQVHENQEVEAIVDRNVEEDEQETEELPATKGKIVPLELPSESSQETVVLPVEEKAPSVDEESNSDVQLEDSQLNNQAEIAPAELSAAAEQLDVEQDSMPLESEPESTTAEQGEEVSSDFELKEVGKPIENFDKELKTPDIQEPAEGLAEQGLQDNFASEPEHDQDQIVPPLAEELSTTRATIGSVDDSSVGESPQGDTENSAAAQPQIVEDIVVNERVACLESEVVPEPETKSANETQQLPAEQFAVKTAVVAEHQEDATHIDSSEITLDAIQKMESDSTKLPEVAMICSSVNLEDEQLVTEPESETVLPSKDQANLVTLDNSPVALQELSNESQTFQIESSLTEKVPIDDSAEEIKEPLPADCAEVKTIETEQDSTVESASSVQYEATESAIDLKEEEGQAEVSPVDANTSDVCTTADSHTVQVQEAELEKPGTFPLTSKISSIVPDVIPTLPPSAESSERVQHVPGSEDHSTTLSETIEPDYLTTHTASASISEIIETPETSASEFTSLEEQTAISHHTEVIAEPVSEPQEKETTPEVLNVDKIEEQPSQSVSSSQPEPTSQFESPQESEVLPVADPTVQTSSESAAEIQSLQTTETSTADCSATDIPEPAISVELPTCAESASTPEVENELQTAEESAGSSHVAVTGGESSKSPDAKDVAAQAAEPVRQITEDIEVEEKEENENPEITAEISETPELVDVRDIPANEVINTDIPVSQVSDSAEQQQTLQQTEITAAEVSDSEVLEDATRELRPDASREGATETSDSIVVQVVESEESQESDNSATKTSSTIYRDLPILQASDPVEQKETSQPSEIPTPIVREVKDSEESVTEPTDAPTPLISDASDSAVVQDTEPGQSQDIPVDSKLPEEREDQESSSNAGPLPSVADTRLIAEEIQKPASISTADIKPDEPVFKIDELPGTVPVEIPEDSPLPSSLEQPKQPTATDSPVATPDSPAATPASSVATPGQVPATPNLDSNVLRELEDIKNTLLNIQQRLTDAGDSLPEPEPESAPSPDSDKPQSCDIAPPLLPQPADALPPTLSTINFSSTQPELKPQPKRERRFSGPFVPVPASVLDDIEAQIMDTAAMLLAQEPSTVEPVSHIQHFAPTQLTSPRYSEERDLEDDPGIEENFVARNIRFCYDKDDVDQLAAATFSDSDVIAADLENAMGELNTLPSTAACSKGSSPDMDDYEVVKSASLPKNTQQEGLGKLVLNLELPENDQEPKVAESLSTSASGSAESVTSFELINSPALQSSPEDKET